MTATRFLADVQSMRRRATERGACIATVVMSYEASNNHPTSRRLMNAVLGARQEHATDPAMLPAEPG